MARSEAVFLQVLNSRLQAITSEMAENVLRAAHSTFIKETWDIAALLVSPAGEVISCPKEVAAKRLGMNLGPALRVVQETQSGSARRGDIWCSNDPIATAGMASHLNDVFLWKPIYLGEVLVCYALVFVHVSDLGGLVPGGISPSASEIQQEGLRLPPVRLWAEGSLVPDVRTILLANSRVPRQLWGDITAVVGALNVCERRITALGTEYDPAVFLRYSARLVELAETRARQLIREIPNGNYRFVDYIDGLPDMEPLRIELTLRVEDETITMDFAGSSPEVGAAYNVYSYSQDGYWGLCRAFSDYFETLDPDIPWNSGLVRPIHIAAPKGSVLNPASEVACGARNATYFRIYYMVFGALSQARPGRLPASGAAESAIMLVATTDPETRRRRINVGQAVFGGSGARAVADGFDGNEMVSWYLRNVPIEILEHEIGVRVREYGLAPGTGGAGRYRGGHGTTITMEFLTTATVTIRGLQRHQFRAWGVEGGEAGARGTITLNPGTPHEKHLDAVTVLEFARGDVLCLASAGGGGHGDPYLRLPGHVAAEIADGLLSEEQALNRYGVVLRDGMVDPDATQTRRDVTRPPAAKIDYGPERTAYEQWWTPEVVAALDETTRRASPMERRRIQEALGKEIGRRMAAGRALPASEVASLLSHAIARL